MAPCMRGRLSERRTVGVSLVLVFMLLTPAATFMGVRSAAVPRAARVTARTFPTATSSLTAPYNIYDFKQAGALAVDPSTGYLYVQDQGYGRTTIYDPARSQVVGYLDGVDGPMAMDPIGHDLVVLRGDGLVFVNVTSGAVDATVSGLAPGGWWNPVLAVDPADGLLFAAYNYEGGATGITMGSTIQIVSLRQRATVAAIGGLWFTQGMGFDPADGDLYVANVAGGMTAIDPRTDVVIGSLTGLDGPNQVAYDAADGELYVASFNGHFENGSIRWTAGVPAVDPSTMQIVGGLPGFDPPSEPTYVVYDDADGMLYVATDSSIVAVDARGYASGSLGGLSYPGPLLYDPVDRTVYASAGDQVLALGPSGETILGRAFAAPDGVALDPVRNLVYAANLDSTYVSVIDAANNRIMGEMDGFVSPDSATYDSLADELFVGNEVNRSLSIVDLRTNETVGAIPDVHPWDVVFDNGSGDLFVGTDYGLDVVSGRTNHVVANLSRYGPLAPLALDAVHGRVFALTQPNVFVPTPLYNLLAIDTADLSLAWNVSVTDVGVSCLGYDPVNNDLYAGRWAGGIEILDASDGRNLTAVPGPFAPQAVLYDPANGYVYVAAQGGVGHLWVLDPRSNAWLQTIELADFPNRMVYDPANQVIYVTAGMPLGSGLVIAVPSLTYSAPPPSWVPWAEGLAGIAVAAAAVAFAALWLRRRRRRGSSGASK